MSPSAKQSHLQCKDLEHGDQPASSIHKPRSRLPALFLILGSLFVSLLVIEIGFRILPYFSHPPTKWSDRPTRFYIANRHDDIPHPAVVVPKDPNEFRVLVLGDSFTFGQAMQRYDSFPARLEQLLNLSAEGKRARVINWGVSGYSTTQEVRLLQEGFEHLKPDLVLLEMTLNDPELEPYRVTHPYLDEHGRVKLHHPVFAYWKSLSFVVTRILNTWTRKEYVHYYEGLFADTKTWIPFTKALAQFKSFLEVKHTPGYAVIFPLFSHPLDETYPFEALHTKIHEELDLLSVPYLDLRSRYKNIPPDRLQVVPGLDSHPNEIAHRIASDAIYERLLREKMVPDEFTRADVMRRR